MGAADVFDILAHYIQNFHLILTQNIPWPSFLSNVKGWLDLIFKFELLGISVPQILDALRDFRIEYRLQYILLNLMIPIIIAIITLLLFKNIFIVTWYFLFLTGFSMVIAGGISYALPSSNYIRELTSLDTLVLIVGGILVSICTIVFLIYCIVKLCNKYRRRRRIDSLAVIRASKKKKLSLNIVKLLQWIIIFILCIFVALFCFGALRFSTFGWETTLDFELFERYPLISFIVGIIAVIIGLFTIIYLVLLISKNGRELLQLISTFLYRHSLNIIFLLLSIVYTPLTTSILTSFSCSWEFCESGTTFPQDLSSLSIQTLTSYKTYFGGNKTSVCVPCTFYPNTTCSIVNELCPEQWGFRLLEYPELDCYRNVMPFIWPSSFIMLIIYVIGVPVLFYQLIKESTISHKKLRIVDYLLNKNYPKALLKLIEQEKRGLDEPIELRNVDEKTPNKPLSKKELRELDEERWGIAVSLTENPIRSIYHSFEFRWKYYRIFSMLIKFLLVAVSILLIKFNYVSVPLTLGIHAIVTTALLISRPYRLDLEDFLSTASSIMNTINSIVPLVGLFVVLPEWIAYVVLGVNGLIVVFGLILTILSFFSTRKEKAIYHTRVKYLKKYPHYLPKGKSIQQIEEDDKDIENHLTKVALRKVVTFFLVLGIFAFIGLTSNIIGLFYNDLNPPYIRSDSISFSSCILAAEMQLAGYESWEEFTSNCCCKEATHYPTDDYRGELWQCKNGKMKERIRVYKDSDKNGLEIRSFCSRDFNDGFELKCASITTGKYKFKAIPPPNITIPQYNLENLW